MRIVYYTHNYFLDSDLPLIRRFQDLGHEVFLFFEMVPYSLKTNIVNIDRQILKTEILSFKNYKELSKFEEYVDLNKSYVLNRPGKIYGLKNILLRIHFWRMISKINPDTILCTDFIDIVDRFLYKYSDKIVQIVHDPFPHTGEYTKRKTINRNYAYKRLRKYVLLNNKQGKDFIKTNKLNPNYIYYNRLSIYECINLYSNDDRRIIDQYDNKKMILFWGRISPYKGINYLLEAMKKVHERCPESRLVIAGYGKFSFDISPYEKLDYIKFINRYLSMEELYSLLSVAKLSVCPYTDATQSGVVMTSYALGVPVVATDVGGLPEMVVDRITGFVVKSQDCLDLANAIEESLNEKTNLNLRNNIRELYTKDGTCSWTNIANEYLRIFSIN